jgi:hypothetical protein
MLLFGFWQGPFPPFPVIPANAGMTGMMKRRAYKAFS